MRSIFGEGMISELVPTPKFLRNFVPSRKGRAFKRKCF